MISAFAAWLKSIIEQIAVWTINVLLMILSWFWDSLLYILELLGIADQIKASATLFDSMPDGVWYFMNIFQIQFGLGAVLIAYLIRFMIRRLPVIG